MLYSNVEKYSMYDRVNIHLCKIRYECYTAHMYTVILLSGIIISFPHAECLLLTIVHCFVISETNHVKLLFSIEGSTTSSPESCS